jgi:hypothetical protein
MVIIREISRALPWRSPLKTTSLGKDFGKRFPLSSGRIPLIPRERPSPLSARDLLTSTLFSLPEV